MTSSPMTNDRPPLFPPFSIKTAFDYLFIAASIGIGIAVIYVRLVM